MLGMIAMLGREGITDRARLVIEKPFGLDLESARELDAALKEVVDEEQVFRIDHFLGKEAVQNILALRFANGLFEPAWDRRSIESVQIDVPEEIDIQGRGSFYEGTGCLRDMISTHLCQLLGFVALEDPGAFEEKHAPRRQVPGVPGAPAVRPGPGRLRPVRRLPRRGGRGPGLTGRDVRRDRGPHRQRPLARRALLPAHRQGAGAELPDHHAALPRPGLRLVGGPVDGRGRPGPQRADPPAHRRGADLAGDARQEAGPGHGAGRGGDEGRLRPGLPARRPARGLRAADPRRAARRPHPVHPLRRGRTALGGLPAAAGRPPEVLPYEKGSWGPQAALDLPEGGWRLGS